MRLGDIVEILVVTDNKEVPLQGRIVGIDPKEKDYYVRFDGFSRWLPEDELKFIKHKEISNEEKTKEMIQKILEMTGLEIGEEFKIKYYSEANGAFSFKDYWSLTDKKGFIDMSALGIIITSPERIIRIPKKKKMTHEEIAAALGYDFEIIEG